ncbi:cadherin repeat domain-containing protein [Psychroserpens algicola]|uniref:cadherin repeat domain-containing protein n=1 Tax=Psychroserpens algicola TaxID=1719034 RepID=UPI00195476EC|nr:cadherin repeat domain-containing protein [Psychroserpens algicola]
MNVLNTNPFKISLILLSVIFITVSCSSEDDSSDGSPTNNNIEVSIDEYPSTGELITTITSNLSGNLTFNITSQSISQAVDINGSSGELRVLAWQVYDFETNPVITVTIDVSNGTEIENKVIIISINNTDDISSFLGNSRTAYINASNGEWILITQSEYNDLANYLSNVSKSGQSDNTFQSTSGINTGGANFTVSNNNAPTIPEGSYLFAFRYYCNQNNIVDTNVKVSETSYQNNFETIGSNLPEHNAGFNYFVLKGNNAQTSTTAYLGIYESNSIGYKNFNGTSYFYESGDAEDLTNDSTNRSYLYQGLSTTLKQWD